VGAAGAAAVGVAVAASAVAVAEEPAPEERVAARRPLAASGRKAWSPRQPVAPVAAAEDAAAAEEEDAVARVEDPARAAALPIHRPSVWSSTLAPASIGLWAGR
jgi:hypothetical protein